MPTITIRPDADSTVGNFSNTPVHAVLSDSNDATFTTNLSQNQNFIVTLDDVSLSGATFNSWAMTVRAKKGKGNASCSARLVSGSVLDVNTSVSVTSASFVDIAAGTASFPSGFSNSDANNLIVRLDTTATQVSISEIFVTIDYTAASGYGQNVNTVAAANIGKVNSVATANIGKVNSVD